MTKLKTVKDFEKEWEKEVKSDSWFLATNELKQVAIKRAKHYISLLACAKFECISYGEPFFKNVETHDDMNFIGRITEIVEFYNLTEEDLK